MRRFIAVSLALLGLAACSSSPGTTTPGGGSVASVSVSPTPDTVVLSQSLQLTASAKDANGAAVAGAAIEWTVTPTTVATVSSSGVVTGVASGLATVTAGSAGKSAAAIIVVREGGVVSSAGGTVGGGGGAATLVIPANALLAALPISVQQSVAPPAAALLVPGTAFDFGPPGTQFAQPITIKLHYDPAQVPPQADPSGLRLYLQTGNSWTLVPGSSVDTAAHVVTGTTTHFSAYAVCTQPCGVGLPAIYVNAVTPGIAAPGSTYTYTSEAGGVAYLGQIALALTGLPPGVTGSITTQPMINDSLGGEHQVVTVTLTIAATAALGQYQLALHATGAPLTLTTAAPILLTIASPNFGIGSSASVFAVAKGSSTPFSIVVARVAFTGSVAVTAENLPAGVTVAFNPPSTTGDAIAATLAVSSSAAPGNYNITLRGKATGLPDVAVPVQLTVRPVSGFALVGFPPSIAVAGGSGQTPIQAIRAISFASTISYAVSGLPAGLTAVVSPTSVADSVVLAVTAAQSLASGTYQLTVTGTAAGATAQQLVVAVTIPSSGIAPIHLDYSGCSTSGQPIWIAFQDGNAPYTRLTATTANVYDATSTQPTGAIAIVWQTSLGFNTTVTQGTQAELAAFTTFSTLGQLTPCVVNTGKTINANVAGTSKLVDIGIGGSQGTYDPTQPAPTPIFNVALGAQDVTALVLDAAAPKMIFRRDQDIPAGGSPALFDFGSAEAFIPASAQVTGIAPSVTFGLYSAGGPACKFTPTYSGPGFGSTIYGIPAALQRPGDLHEFGFFASNGTSVTSYFHSMANLTLTPGPALSAQVTPGGGAFKRLYASTVLAADYQSFSLDYRDSNNHEVNQVITPGYAGGNNISLVAPALNTVTGYQLGWAPSGTVTYTAAAASVNLVTRSGPICSSGVTVKQAVLQGAM